MYAQNKINYPSSDCSERTFELKASGFITAVIVLCVGIFVMCWAINIIEEIIPCGFNPEYKISASGYTKGNDIFDSYVPSVNVELQYGYKTMLINTPMVTVEEMLEGQGIYLDSNDKVSVALDEKVDEAMRIVVDKIDKFQIELTETVPFEIQTNNLRTIPYNTVEIVQEGNNGVTKKLLRQTYENGELIDETIISTEIITPVVNEIRNVGVGGTITGSNGTVYYYSYYVDVIATAYGGEEFSGLTYSGKQVELGMIAVDPEYIPLGSEVYLINQEGDLDLGVCQAEDTGSLIIQNRIDVYMGPDDEAVEAAKKFGRKELRAYILR